MKSPVYPPTDQTRTREIVQNPKASPPARLKNWLGPLLFFLFWRASLVALVFLGSAVIRPVFRAGNSPYIVGSSGFWSDHLLAVGSRWDGEWYLQIASHGYHTTDGTAAFFPLFPALLKGIGSLLLGNDLLAGTLLAMLATAAVFVLLYELTRRDFGSPSLAVSTLVYLAVFPTAFFLAAIYTESLFLALVLGAFLCVRHLDRWWVAGLLLMLATLCRSLGILVVLPLMWEWWSQNRSSKFLSRVSLSKLLPIVLLPGLALLGWLVFNWLVLGDALTFLKIQSPPPNNRNTTWLWQTLIQATLNFLTPPPGSAENYNLLDFAALMVTLAVLAGAVYLVYRRRYPLSYLIYFGLAILLPLTTPAVGEPLKSFPRFALVMFPIFQILAMSFRRIPILNMLYLLVGAVGLAFLFSRFIQWYWVA